MIEKKWIFIGIGVFIVVVGMVSWGVATDWKFIGGKKSGSGGPSPPSPPSEDPCDPTKCKQCSSDKKKCMLCYGDYTLNDGICVCQDENKKSNNCCPKGYTRDNTSSCCQNNSLTTTGECCNSPVCPFGNIKVCCDGVYQQCDNDGKKRGCYISCGSEKCYNGGKCVDDGKGQKYCKNTDCQWKSIPSTNPSYISDITIKNFPDCENNPKCTVNSDGTCTLNTTGITTTDNGDPMIDSQGNPYTFIYKPSYSKNMLPKKYKMVSEITATPDTTKCNTEDCNNILSIFGNGTITNDMPTTCKMRYDGANVMDFPADVKCPFENVPTSGRGNPALRCCPGVNVETTGQICPEGTVGAMKKEEGGLIFECVSVEQCVGDNGKICGGNGNCEYDPTLKNGKGGGKGGGKCVCDPTYSGDKCQIANPCSTELDNVYVVPFCVDCGNSNDEYTDLPTLLRSAKLHWEPVKFNDTKLSISYYEVARNTNKGKHGLEILTTLLTNLNNDQDNVRFTFEVVNKGQIYVITNQDESLVLYGDKDSVNWIDRQDSWGTNWYDYTGNKSTDGTWHNYNRWDKLGDPGIQYRCCWTIIRATDQLTKKIYCSLMNVAEWFTDLDYWYGAVVAPPGKRTCWTFEDDCNDTSGNNGDRSFRGFNKNDQYFLTINSDATLQLSSIYGGTKGNYKDGSNIFMFCHSDKTGNVYCKRD